VPYGILWTGLWHCPQRVCSLRAGKRVAKTNKRKMVESRGGDAETRGGRDFYQKTVCGGRLGYHFPVRKRNLSKLRKVWSVTVKG